MKSKSIRSAAFCLATLALIPSAHAWGDREQAALAGALIGGLIASNAQVAGGAAAFPAPVGPAVYMATPGVAYRVSPGYVTGPVMRRHQLITLLLTTHRQLHRSCNIAWHQRMSRTMDLRMDLRMDQAMEQRMPPPTCSAVITDTITAGEPPTFRRPPDLQGRP